MRGKSKRIVFSVSARNNKGQRNPQVHHLLMVVFESGQDVDFYKWKRDKYYSLASDWQIVLGAKNSRKITRALGIEAYVR